MKIWTPIPVETKKALERGECVGQTIQDSPWEVSVESVGIKIWSAYEAYQCFYNHRNYGQTVET